MAENQNGSESVMTVKEAVMEIRADVKELLAWKNKLIGGLAIVGSGTTLALILSVLGIAQ